MMLSAAFAQMRFRIRSWSDLLLVLVVCGIIAGLRYLLEDKLNMDERPAKIITYSAAAVAAFVWLLCTRGR